MTGKRIGIVSTAIVSVVLAAGTASAQEPTATDVLGIPREATVLEGLPDVRVEVTDETVTRRQLDADESEKDRLRMRVKDGRLFTDEGPLSVSESGGFTYLTSTQPGRYVRLRRVNDRLMYAEHIDMGERSVTYWGELRIVVGR